MPVLAGAMVPALGWVRHRRAHDPTPLAMDGPQPETTEHLCAELGCLPPAEAPVEPLAAAAVG